MSEDVAGLNELVRKLALAAVNCTSTQQESTGQQTLSSDQQRSDGSLTEKDRLYQAWYCYFLQLHQQDGGVEKWLLQHAFANQDNPGTSSAQGSQPSRSVNTTNNEYLSELETKGPSSPGACLTWQEGGSTDEKTSMLFNTERQPYHTHNNDGRIVSEEKAAYVTLDYIPTSSILSNPNQKPSEISVATRVFGRTAIDRPLGSVPQESGVSSANTYATSNPITSLSRGPELQPKSSSPGHTHLGCPSTNRKHLAQTPHNSIDDEWMVSSCPTLLWNELTTASDSHQDGTTSVYSIVAGQNNCQTVTTSINPCGHLCLKSAFQTLPKLEMKDKQKDTRLTAFDNTLRRSQVSQKSLQRYVVRVTNIQRYCHCGQCVNFALVGCTSVSNARENIFSSVYVTFQAHLPSLTPIVKNNNGLTKIPPAVPATGLRMGFICSLASHGPSLQDFANPQIAEKMDVWEQAGDMPGFRCQVLSALHDTVEVLLQQIRENGLNMIQVNVDYVYFPPTTELRPLHARRRQSSASSDGSLPRLAAARPLPEPFTGSSPQHTCVGRITESTSRPSLDRQKMWSQLVQEARLNRCHTWHPASDVHASAIVADPPYQYQGLTMGGRHGESTCRALTTSFASLPACKEHGQNGDRFKQSTITRSRQFLPARLEPREESLMTAFSRDYDLQDSAMKSCSSGDLEKLFMNSAGKMNSDGNDIFAFKNTLQEIFHRLSTKTNLPLVVMPTNSRGNTEKSAPKATTSSQTESAHSPLIFQLPHANSAFVCLPAIGTHPPRVVTAPKNTALVVLPATNCGSGNTNNNAQACSSCARGACSQPVVLTGPKAGYILLLNDDNRFEYIPKK